MRRRNRALLAAAAFASLSLVSAVLRAQEAEDDGEEMPAGHPGAQPGSAHSGGIPGMFQPPPDTNEEDPRLAPGTIAITILDPDNAPLENTSVTLGILHNSVAKGESREHKLATTDKGGAVSFTGLEHASGIAYRVSVVKDGGTFWAAPFGLAPEKGERVVLHVYPVAHDVQTAVVVAQVAMYAEMKDDRVQLEEAITFYNMGKTAWVPDDLVLALPSDFTALTSQDGMGGEGVTAIEKKGAKIRGTFGPGQHALDFRWQLPYAGEKDVTIDQSLPPHVAVMRVMAAASQEMRLVASGFPEAVPKTDARGERLLITEKQMRRDDPALTHVHVELRDIPVPGPARIIATILASLGVLAGIGFAFSTRKGLVVGGSAKEERARLLTELEELERSHRAGDVGPKTYERARRELIDAIARTLAQPVNEPQAAPQ
jgi:hypothetical protein